MAHVAPQVRVPEPGYQLFGNIRDRSRWDRAVGRAAGETELKRMTDWFHQQRPDAGEVVAEVHPGLYLPPGSILKVYGHDLNVVRCVAGYGFRELCADHAQAWDWGVAAWVQWRWLTVQLEGLHSRSGKHTLHVHAFDPESRDISQRVHFIHPTDDHAPQLCVRIGWPLPKGLEGRWQPDALCSIPIPKQCSEWPAVKVWISPLEKTHLYDWIAERGAPGLFSHLWLTVDKSETS